jgi:NitT/TauT family transport system ATP-binding protein
VSRLERHPEETRMAQSALGARSEPLLELHGVSKAFGKPPRQFLAVRDIELTIRPGELVCLLGPSGCGKSTLLRIVAGLNRATSGRVLYRGTQLDGVNPHTTIVFQTFALFPWLTVLANVEVALKARGIERARRRERALALVDMVGLDGFESAYPRELSGGMRQKVGFARAMAVEPELLCLDEPFSALDVLSAETLRGELLELWLGRKIPTRAILMVTHNIEEAVLLADRVVVMSKEPGRIVAEIPVTLRHPRQRKDTAFLAEVDRIYSAVAGRTPAEPELLAPAARRNLPRARPNAMAGLLEKLHGDGGRADLYRLSGELLLELDDLLPVVEAAELLGTVRVEQGDLLLTELGRTFAEASILARKEIVAARALRLPLILWIYEMLQKDDNHRVALTYFVEGLRAEIGDRADEQLDIAIQWGRYSELFAYDDLRGEVYLEP